MYIAEPGNEEAEAGRPARDAADPKKVDGQVLALQETVNSGRVMLDPATGEDMRKMLQEQIDQVDSWLERAGRLARPAPLGANPVGDKMAQKFEARAEGDELSFVSVMTAYREVLQQTHDSVRSAIRNFLAVDEEHRAELTRLSGN
ncbi:hypothetical protein ABZ816_29960 [Actinosynnema sp. NPDC047251]|uniref:PE domain-containing protein n=1 Tax=Saccharothrix espanaensis (strain ATCC 51144 / DSM 44229 / JCM 9112 / NBRC 15066 / NRRL 15764) TaxID=1179773 RepID=K0KD31_SACES|nr:hypothetical protein [Saccharothrix espanaensis]CCH34694.1 hypothetical protein BN6_74670 [Saccharothrix espanaensis DSM 44229]